MSSVAAPVAAPPRIFRGWYVVGISVAGAFLSAGMAQVFMGVMLKPITADLGWSRTEVAGALTAGTLCGGFLSPFFGRLADRFGPRVMAPVGALIVVGMFFALGSVNSLLQFYIAYII